jgi:hypothetical protein
MIRPTLERAPHFVGVFGAIINSRDRSFVSRLVIKDRFYVVGLDAKLSHVGSC